MTCEHKHLCLECPYPDCIDTDDPKPNDRSEYMRKRYEANREEILKKAKSRYQAKKKTRLAYWKTYYEEHKEIKLAQKREYYLKNRDEILYKERERKRIKREQKESIKCQTL